MGRTKKLIGKVLFDTQTNPRNQDFLFNFKISINLLNIYIIFTFLLKFYTIY